MDRAQAQSPRTPKTPKRKREASFASDPSAPPPSAQAINPHSHPPAKLAQFAVAGLSDTDQDPVETLKDFPHRGLGHKGTDEALESEYETGAEEEDSDGREPAKGRGPKAKRPPDTHRRHLDILIKSMHQLLGQGEVTKAARAFGLALQLRPHHGTVDIRRDSLWALGAEVIMREGEEDRLQNMAAQAGGDGGVSPGAPQRWGAAANMGKLRAYYETLIQQHPYDYKSPKNISALHFNISLYSCEIYNVYSEHVASLSRCGAGAGVDDSLMDEDSEIRLETLVEDESFHTTQEQPLREKVIDPKDRIRRRTLEAMKAVTSRMDSLMKEMPYQKNHELLRLRVSALLFMADLAVPFDRTTPTQLREVEEQRGREIATAKHTLQTLLQSGGVLNQDWRALAEADDGDDSMAVESRIHSVLPIRRA